MADTDLGDLSFTLSVKSNVEEQMEKIRKSIEKTKHDIKDLENIAGNTNTDKKTALVSKLAADKLRKGISEYESGLKSLGTRYNQILDVTKKIEESSKAVHNLRKGGVGPFDPKELRSYSKELGNLMRRVIAISKGNLNGPNFKMGLGDVKRELSQISKGIGGITSGASKAGAKAAREAQKVVDDFEKAEDQAAKYYRTRKTRVEEAITSLSKKQGQLHEMMGNASKEDANLMKAASDQAEILIKRLSAAKEQYERMQTLKAQGVQGAALSATYLGRYTGMSELFGGNFSKLDKTGIADALSNFAGGGTLPYSGFLQMYREVVALGKSHAETQEQYNKQESKEAAEKERVYQQTLDKTNRDLERNQKAAERTAEAQTKAAERSAKAEIDAANATEVRIARLRSILSEGLATRRDSRSLGLNVDELTEKLRRLAQVILAIRADKQGFGYATNLFDKGADKVEISSIQEKIRAQRELNAEKERQQRIDERNNNSLIANRDKRGYVQNNIDSILGKWADISPNVQNSQISKIVKNLQNLSKSLSGLSDKDLMDANAVTNLLRRRHYGTMAKEIGAFFRQYRQEAMAAAAEAKTASEAEDKLKTQINKLRALSERWNTRENFAKSGTAASIAATQRSALSGQANNLEGIKRSDFKTDAEYIKAVNDALIRSKHLQEEAAIAAAQYNNENRQAADAAKRAADAQKQVAAAARESTDAARSLASAFSKVHDKSSSISRVMQEMKSVFFQGGVVYTAQSLVNSIVQQGGMIEQQHIALRTMIGDAQVADNLFGQIKQLAIDSPFTFSEMIRDTKMMTAYGVATKDVYDTTKRLADISAGLGISVERLALAFSQTQARGWLDAKELRQFAYAGLPMLNKLSQYYTAKEGKDVSTADVTKRIKKRQVAFEDVRDVLWQMTDEGGQFFDMQDKLTDTLLGKYNKLKDAWDIMMSNFTTGGNAVGETFKGILDVISELIQNVDKLTPVLISMGAAFGGKALIGTIQGKFGAGKILADMNKAVIIANNEFAVREMSRVAEGQITMSVARQNIERHKALLASSEMRNMTYSQLLAEGKMSMFQLGRLAKAGQISLSLVGQLNLTGQLTRYQALLVLQATRYAGTWRGTIAQMRLGLTGLWSSIKGFFSWGNLITFGIGAVSSLALSYEQKVGQINDNAQAGAEKYKKKADDIDDAIRKTNGNISKGTVNAMKAALSQAGQLTDEVQNQVNKASTLAEKYEILRQKMEDVLRVSKDVGNSQTIADAIKRSAGARIAAPDTNGFMRGFIKVEDWIMPISQFFGTNPQYINDNIAKINEFQSVINKLRDSLRCSFDDIDKAFKTVTDNANDSVFYKKISKLPFERRIDAILNSKYADRFINELDRINNGAGRIASRLLDYSQDLAKRIRQVTEKNVPLIVGYILDEMGLLGISTSKWSNNQVQTFVLMFNHIMESAGMMSRYVRSKVYQAFLDSSGLSKNLNPSGLRSYTIRENGKWKTIRIADEGDDKKGHYVIAGFSGKKGHRIINKIYDPSADKPEPEPIRGNMDDTGSKNKNKNKGSHSDRYLKARQKEASAIQSYYDAWNNWRDVEGDERARERVANDPRFSAEFRAKYPDPSDLVANYEKLAETTKANTDERRQFVQEYKAKAVEEEGKIELENAKRLNNVFKEQLDNISKRYEIYKKLKEVAGRDVAGAYAFGNNKHSESYYAYLLSKLSKMGNVKDFVDNGLPDGSTIGGITVKTKANKVDFSKYGGLEGVMGLSDDTVLHEYGTNVANLIKALKAERDKLDQSIAETITKGYQYFNDYAVQIQAINDKYDEQIERLKERNKLNKDNLDYVSDDDLKRGTEIANQMRGRETAAVNLKQFKDSDTYRKFFGATFLLGTKEAAKSADTIMNAVTAAFNSGALSAEEYASKIKEIEEQMNSISSRRSVLFSYLTGGIDSIINQRRGEDAQKEIERGSDGLAEANELYQKGVATPGKAGFDMMSQAMSQQDDARKVIQNGIDMMRGANQAATAMSIIDKVVQGINRNVQSLGSLCEDIASDIETLSGTNASEDFRSSTGYTFVGAFSKASQGATDAWNSLKSGNIMGVAEDGYRSIMGWITPWAQRHDNKLQRQIEIAQRQLNAIQGLQSSIERGLSNSLGGVYGYTSNSRDSKKIREGLDNYSLAKTGAKYGHNTYGQSALIGTGIGAAAGAGAGLLAAASTGALAGSIAGPLGVAIGAIGGVIGGAIGSLFGHKKKKYKTNYSDDTYQAMQHAGETQAYYDQMYASYKMQRDNLNAQLRAEKGKKKSDKDKIQDYQNSIEELDDKIKTFAKDQAKALYNIDVNDYASQLTDAIVSAWASGEDAAEAYKNKVTDIMRDLAKNIIAKKVMAKYLEPVEDFIEKEMDRKSGKLDEDSIIEIAKKLQSASTDGINTVTAILEKLKDAGVDLSDNSSSSASSSIKGITENTADILASYVNAIRADVSVIRQLEGLYLPKFDVTILAQLEQQKAIAENTRATAEAASSIRDSVITVVEILHASQTQARPLSVKVN